MQFVCPYCGPIDWNNKYSYSYSYIPQYQLINLPFNFFFISMHDHGGIPWYDQKHITIHLIIWFMLWK